MESARCGKLCQKCNTYLALSFKEVITNWAMYYTFPMFFQKHITTATKHRIYIIWLEQCL